MRIVIDTNVIASAVFFGGRPYLLLEKLLKKDLDAVVTPDILAEYKETFDELCSRYPDKPVRIPFTHIVSACKIVIPSRHLHVCRDPDDDKFIDCALEGKCLYIVSGDKDLLSLEKIQDVEIITVAGFFERFPDL